MTPAGIEPTDHWRHGAVDVFYIAPTLTFTKLHWNAPINHPSSTELIEEMIMPGQASVFNGCCRIFSPKYRQATFYSFLGAGSDGRRALELAYEDCRTAFDHYLQHENEGRPFFLAGHSQGALHLMRLLDDVVDRANLSKKLVAAYPIGFWFPADKFGKTLHRLQPARSATDVGCVVAYDTFLESGGPLPLGDRAEVVYGGGDRPRWVARTKRKPLGINPLSWQTDLKKAAADQHRGGVHIVLESGERPTWDQITDERPTGLNCVGLCAADPQQCSAQLRKDGFLYVSSPKNRAFRLMEMPGRSLHLYDYSLFYMNLRQNVLDRWAAYQKLHPTQI